MAKIFKRGSGLGQWTYGDRVTTIADLVDGDILISENHEFDALNIVKVTRVKPSNPGFYGYFVDPIDKTKKRQKSDREFHVWESEMESDFKAWYRAIPRPIAFNCLYKVAEANNSDITAGDLALLQFESTYSHVDGFGYVLHIELNEGQQASKRDALQAAGFSTKFLKIYQAAQDLDVSWLIFDSDGVAVTENP